MSRSKRRGQGMTEYIVIVALVAIASIGVVTMFGNQVRELFAAATGRIQGKDTNPSPVGDPSTEVNKDIAHY